MKQLGLVVLLALVAVFGFTCWRDGIRDEREKERKAVYDKTTDSLTTELRGALSRRDTLIQRVPVEVIKIVRDSAKAATAKAAVVVADAGGDSSAMIRTRDNLIAAQDTVIGWVRDTVIDGKPVQVRAGLRGHVATLTSIVVADSAVIRVFRRQRGTDSTRIKDLEKSVGGWTVLGIKLPKVKCTVGGAAVVYPKQAAGLGGGCGFTF